jgi:large subunit ribosomal protein L4
MTLNRPPSIRIVTDSAARLSPKWAGEHDVIVLPQPDETIERAGRNLPSAKVVRVGGLNVYDVLRFKHLVTTPNGIRAIEERLAS